MPQTLTDFETELDLHQLVHTEYQAAPVYSIILNNQKLLAKVLLILLKRTNQ